MLADNETHYSNGSNGTYNFFFEDPRFISILKRRGTNYTSNIGDAIKFLEDWRRLNMSVVKECERSEYCYGEFRDLILAYNSIHGYVSLLVSVSFYYSTYFKTKFIAFNYVKYHIRFAFPKFILKSNFRLHYSNDFNINSIESIFFSSISKFEFSFLNLLFESWANPFPVFFVLHVF